MESLHGQAMGEIAHEKDYQEDLEEIAQGVDEIQQWFEEAVSVLSEFLENHPTFTEEFGFTVDTPLVESWDLDSVLRETEYPRSEWEAAALYGYSFGVSTARYRIEKNIESDLDEFREATDE